MIALYNSGIDSDCTRLTLAGHAGHPTSFAHTFAPTLGAAVLSFGAAVPFFAAVLCFGAAVLCFGAALMHRTQRALT